MKKLTSLKHLHGLIKKSDSINIGSYTITYKKNELLSSKIDSIYGGIFNIQILNNNDDTIINILESRDLIKFLKVNNLFADSCIIQGSIILGNQLYFVMKDDSFKKCNNKWFL